ncbi:MAG: sigma-54-dependent Fis family transcriptional regulator [Chromatiales bacterium]|nr:sigma-54-dependent Fis family transcriptional regulator [Chromatiales bacterium]
MSHILILEDEHVIRSALRRLLERKGYTVAEAGSVAEARKQQDLKGFDLILTDLRLPGAPGTDIIRFVGDTPVLIMTSYASVRSAVESMQSGAADYIAKPFDHDELLIMVEKLIRQSRLSRQNTALKSDLQREYPVAGMIGCCQSMQQVFDRITRVAPTDTTVLILGESGTGKELVARALHEKSRRRDAPLIAVNCASIPETLIESELFGHEKGAFTGASETRRGMVESADGGTLFLDEIGELPLTAQAKLLRVLQDGEIRRVGAAMTRKVDVRLLAATHRDLQRHVNEGLFRSDLYFRLRVMEVHLPPLRQRGDDLLELANYLLEKTCQRLNRSRMHFGNEAVDAMRTYAWPGNVRELENAIERAVILSDSDEISAELLAIESGHSEPSPAMPDLSLEEYFRAFVLDNQDRLTETELAKRLGISRKALWERRQRFGLPRTNRRA